MAWFFRGFQLETVIVRTPPLVPAGFVFVGIFLLPLHLATAAGACAAKVCFEIGHPIPA